MLFNSIPFLIFLPAVFLLYWMIPGKWVRAKNVFILAASYLFYGWWDWRFLVLIAISSVAAWGLGWATERYPERKRVWLWASCLINFGILAYFKYANFFIDQMAGLLANLGFSANPVSLQVILPVGISFYTFQAISYTIDVYRGTIRPTRDLVAFMAYVSYFPQLVAGPIERAQQLLPQFLARRNFDYALAVDGCRQMLWGFFKKMVVADNCARAANAILNTGGEVSGIALWVGMFCFAMQIYGDFSGYSDIAIGCSRLFGIRLMRNFAYPYFSRDIAEFWRRWHISLSTWFRDYLYIPLGGSRLSKPLVVRNVFAIFLVSGFWHGANWTFIAWGLAHALFFLPLLLGGKNRIYTDVVAQGRWLPGAVDLLRMGCTFVLVVLAWVFFRVPDIATAALWLKHMVTLHMGLEGINGMGAGAILRFWHWIAIMLLVEWVNRGGAHGLCRIPGPKVMRWALYLGMIFLVLAASPKGGEDFIYFQF